MDKMSLADFQSIDKRFEKDILASFDYEKSVEMRSAAGGTSKASVLEQVDLLKKLLA
jgi:argininosuccinate lyase